MELLVFHADEQYLSDVKSLQRYLQSELNVRDITPPSGISARRLSVRRRMLGAIDTLERAVEIVDYDEFRVQQRHAREQGRLLNCHAGGLRAALRRAG